MTIMPLATGGDVALALRRGLTLPEQDCVDTLILAASERFIIEAGRAWDPGEATVRLQVVGGSVNLGVTPVLVTAVVDDDGAPVAHTVAGQWLRGIPLPSDRFVTVTYQADEPVPALVTSTVAGMVARVFQTVASIPLGLESVTQGAGPFNEALRFASWAQNGQLSMSPEDLRVARSYRPTGPSLFVTRSRRDGG